MDMAEAQQAKQILHQARVEAVAVAALLKVQMQVQMPRLQEEVLFWCPVAVVVMQQIEGVIAALAALRQVLDFHHI
jgi:hypothetical protein